MTKRFGFTLAEVLITLGIIGVVAAMSIPALIANTNSAKFKSQFKKSLSSLNQAALMSQAQYDFDFAGAGKCTAATDNPAHATAPKTTICALLNGTLAGASVKLNHTTLKTNKGGNYGVNGSKTEATKLAGENTFAYTMADGSLFVFDKDAESCTLTPGAVAGTTLNTASSHCKGWIDVNGATLPNKEVTCDDESAANTTNTPCAVTKQTSVTDIFPVVIHDSVVEAGSNAAKSILTSAK